MANIQADTLDYGADVAPPVGDNLLASIEAVANEVLSADAAVSAAEEALKAAKEKHKDLVERQLPELMDAARQIEITTASNVRVKITDQVRATIGKDPGKAAAAFTLLREKSLGSIIKNEVDIVFEAGRDQEALGLALLLQLIARSLSVRTALDDILSTERKIAEPIRKALSYLALTEAKNVARSQTVHPQTLAANVRELLADGKITTAEMETLGAHAYKLAAVKRKD